MAFAAARSSGAAEHTECQAAVSYSNIGLEGERTGQLIQDDTLSQMDCNDFVVLGQVPETLRYEPEEGWKVQAYHYYTSYGEGEAYGKPACIFLAENVTGQQQGVQWWLYDKPTAFHGEWQQGACTLCVRFNARGPFYEDGTPRPWKGAHLLRRPASTEHPMHFFEGCDQDRRRVKMVPYGKWTLLKEGEQLVWQDA